MSLTQIKRRLFDAQPKKLTIWRGEDSDDVTLIGRTDIRVDQFSEINLNKVFYRTESNELLTLGQILAADVIAFDNADALYDFILAAYPEEFVNVTLYYTTYDNNFDDFPEFRNVVLHGENPYEAGGRIEDAVFAFDITSTEYANERAQKLIDQVKGDLYLLGIDVEDGSTDLQQRLVDHFNDCNTSDPVGDSIDNTDPFFVQSQLIPPGYTYAPDIDIKELGYDGEGHLNFTDAMLEKLLRRYSIPVTKHNVEQLAICLNEYWYPGAWLELTLFTRVELKPFWDDVESDTVTLERPWLFVGNVEGGAGFASEKPLEGSVTIPRDRLFDDSKAHGYSIDEMHGFVESYFTPSTVTLTRTEEAA